MLEHNVDSVLHVLEVDVLVRARLKIDRDLSRTAIGGRGDHGKHVLNAVDGLFERSQDRVNQAVGTGTGIRNGDVDGRRCDAGNLGCRNDFDFRFVLPTPSLQNFVEGKPECLAIRIGGPLGSSASLHFANVGGHLGNYDRFPERIDHLAGPGGRVESVDRFRQRIDDRFDVWVGSVDQLVPLIAEKGSQPHSAHDKHEPKRVNPDM